MRSQRIREHIRERRLVLGALVAVLALAFGLRVASYESRPHPVGAAGLAAEQAEMARHIVDDGRWFVLNQSAYDLLKKRQAKEGRLVDLSQVDFTRVDQTDKARPVVDQMPGIAVLLSGLWWLTGDKTYTGLQWLQILLDTAMVLLVYWIARRLTGRTAVGLLAGLFYAVWWKGIGYAKIPILDTWAVFFTIACVALFVWAREEPGSRRRLLLLGLCAGAAMYFRPFVLFVPVALALVAAPGASWRSRVGWLVVPTVIALLVLAPWTVRNYYTFHRFIPTRTGLGQAVFEGSGQAATGKLSGDEGSSAFVRKHNKGATYGSPSYDGTLFSAAIHGVARDPAHYARLVIGRLRFFLPCLLLLLVWRRWGRVALVPVAAAAATGLPYIFIGGDRRFYLPMFFAYFILLAMTADVLVSVVLRSRSASVPRFPRALRPGERGRG